MISGLISTWARLLAQVWRAYKSKVILLLILTVFASLADGATMALLLPLMSLVGVAGGSQPGTSTLIDKGFSMLGLQPSLEIVLVAIIGIFVVQRSEEPHV